MERYRAVLVDDVPELRRLLRNVLEWSERFEVVGEANHGRAAIDLAGEVKPDLVLLDISMPVMDGMEALPRLLEVSPGSKVVMLSGFEAERLGRAAIEMGAADYVEKGTPPAQVIERLLKVMGAAPQPEAEPPAAVAPQGPEEAILDVSPEEMMSLVAHEIRNPLAVIQGFGMELHNRWENMPDHLRRDAVRRMTERARYLNTVVSNLMYMRKLGQKPKWMDPGTEKVAELLDLLVDELKDMTKDHPLELQVDEGLPPVKVDVARFRQVLTNLFVNAAKFSPSGASIQVTASGHSSGVVVRVMDQGPGIPDDKRDAVFEKFKRLESGGSGIGLGLYVSKALMDSLNGQIWVEDSPSGGACIACLLPSGN